jgi:hypothetical protein
MLVQDKHVGEMTKRGNQADPQADLLSGSLM